MPPWISAAWRGWTPRCGDIPMMFARSPQAKGRVERTAGTFQDRLITGLPLAGAPPMETGRGRPPAVPAPVQPAFPGASPVSCACFPVPASGSSTAASPVLQEPQGGGERQHRQVPEADPATAAQPGATRLCRGPSGDPGRARRPLVATARWTHKGWPRSSSHPGPHEAAGTLPTAPVAIPGPSPSTASASTQEMLSSPVVS